MKQLLTSKGIAPNVSFVLKLDGGADPAPDPAPEPKPDVKARVAEALEKRYQPQSVREWLARHKDDAELALEKAVEMLNDRIQKQIKGEVESTAKIEELESSLKAKTDELATIAKEAADLKAADEARSAVEREAAIGKAIGEKYPSTQKALMLALKNEGYALELEGSEVMAVKSDKRHKLTTILNDDFYKEYPFAKPQDESPLGGKLSGDAKVASEVAKVFSQKPVEGQNDPFDWRSKGA